MRHVKTALYLVIIAAICGLGFWYEMSTDDYLMVGQGKNSPSQVVKKNSDKK